MSAVNGVNSGVVNMNVEGLKPGDAVSQTRNGVDSYAGLKFIALKDVLAGRTYVSDEVDPKAYWVEPPDCPDYAIEPD